MAADSLVSPVNNLLVNWAFLKEGHFLVMARLEEGHFFFLEEDGGQNTCQGGLCTL